MAVRVRRWGVAVLGLALAGMACQGRVATGCPAPSTACDAQCVDLDTDPTNCGGCGATCNGGQVCVDGSCADECPPGSTKCTEASHLVCVQTQTDNANCGACGHSCNATEGCVDGVCATQCGPQETLCTLGSVSACVATASDNANCGACGNQCPTGSQCSSGACACFMGATLCQQGCAVTWNDPWNCGACGHACAAGEVCTSANCAVVLDSSGVRWFAVDDTTVYVALRYEIRKQPIDLSSAPTLVTPANNAYAVALDEAFVYWIDDGGLAKIPKAGGAATALGGVGYPYSLVVANGTAYVSDYWNLVTCSTSGCGQGQAFSNVGGSSLRVANDALYWVFDKYVYDCSLSGCSSPITFASAKQTSTGIGAVAVDGASAFWTEVDGSNSTIETVALSGGTPTALASGLNGGGAIEVDDSTVYFATADGLFAVPKGGGTPQLVSNTSPQYFAVRGSHVFMQVGDSLIGEEK